MQGIEHNGAEALTLLELMLRVQGKMAQLLFSPFTS
jgi:hypothetical protein